MSSSPRAATASLAAHRLGDLALPLHERVNSGARRSHRCTQCPSCGEALCNHWKVQHLSEVSGSKHALARWLSGALWTVPVLPVSRDSLGTAA
jgi:hypothetical protein